MSKREAKNFKALYFDLCVKDLAEYYSNTNPTGAYRQIRDFLRDHNFSHEQYSGYHSHFKTTDLEIFDLIREMSDKHTWLRHCIKHFEVTNVGANHDLMCLFNKEVPNAETV